MQFKLVIFSLLLIFSINTNAEARKKTKYYLGIEQRYSMAGKLVSESHLLVERAPQEDRPSVIESMVITTLYGNFEATIEFRFSGDGTFQVINKNVEKEVGQGTFIGQYDNVTSMIDTVIIEQTKETVTSVFSFDGLRITVGKTYQSTESGKKIGYSIEKCIEIDKGKYDLLKSHPDAIGIAWEGIQF